MQSEEFDKKIKEAADYHHPAYDESAWVKMERLLNKHLPQKNDDRRRYLFLLFLFLLAGGGAYLMIAKPWHSNKPLINKTVSKNTPVNSIKTADAGNSEKISDNRNISEEPIQKETINLQNEKQHISRINRTLQI